MRVATRDCVEEVRCEPEDLTERSGDQGEIKVTDPERVCAAHAHQASAPKSNEGRNKGLGLDLDQKVRAERLEACEPTERQLESANVAGGFEGRAPI